MAAGGKNKQDKKVVRQKMTCGVQVGTVMNCADNSGAKVLKMISARHFRGRLNLLPKASMGDIIVCTVKKGKPELRKTVVLAVVIRQRMHIRRREGSHLCFEDNAAVIVMPNGDLKGSQIAGPVSRETGEMWPKISSQASAII